MKDYYVNKKILITGGSGFIGSFLVEKLLEFDAQVIAIDNFITGNRNNLKSVQSNPMFQLIEADASREVSTYLSYDVDAIFHMASPASPRGYMDAPIETYSVNSFGTHYLAKYALDHKIPILFASTSEAYGEPKEHPQNESYWGNVNPIGVRSCYDVSKRFGEMVLTTMHRKHNLDARIVRIFNTYGPRMDPKDGRVMPNLITQALANKPLTVHGDGTQTRSFCYVSDLIEYIIRTMSTKQLIAKPVNIGNTNEITINELAEKIQEMIPTSPEITFTKRPEDDPTIRQPDISLAVDTLNYSPQISLEEGLKKTIKYFQNEMKHD